MLWMNGLIGLKRSCWAVQLKLLQLVNKILDTDQLILSSETFSTKFL